MITIQHARDKFEYAALSINLDSYVLESSEVDRNLTIVLNIIFESIHQSAKAGKLDCVYQMPEIQIGESIYKSYANKLQKQRVKLICSILNMFNYKTKIEIIETSSTYLDKFSIFVYFGE